MSDETTRKPDDPRPDETAPEATPETAPETAPESAPEGAVSETAAPDDRPPGEQDSRETGEPPEPAAQAPPAGPPPPPVDPAPTTPATRTGGSGGAAPPPAGGSPALPPGGGHEGGHGGGYGHGGPAPYKPSKVTTIAVLDLVDGILNVLIGIGWVFGALAFGAGTAGCGCFLVPLGAYPLVLGVLEIVYASQLLPARPRNVGIARWLAVMQIIAILYGQVLSVVAGVLKLVFAEDPEVRDYLARTRTADPLAGGS